MCYIENEIINSEIIDTERQSYYKNKYTQYVFGTDHIHFKITRLIMNKSDFKNS